MAAAESISVPSQSKTSRSKFLGTRRLAGIEAGKEDRQLGRQRRFQFERGPGHGVHDHGPERVQEHALQPLPGELLVESEVAVLIVPGDRVFQVSKMHADLMR